MTKPANAPMTFHIRLDESAPFDPFTALAVAGLAYSHASQQYDIVGAGLSFAPLTQGTVSPPGCPHYWERGAEQIAPVRISRLALHRQGRASLAMAAMIEDGHVFAAARRFLNGTMGPFTPEKNITVIALKDALVIQDEKILAIQPPAATASEQEKIVIYHAALQEMARRTCVVMDPGLSHHARITATRGAERFCEEFFASRCGAEQPLRAQISRMRDGS